MGRSCHQAPTAWLNAGTPNAPAHLPEGTGGCTPQTNYMPRRSGAAPGSACLGLGRPLRQTKAATPAKAIPAPQASHLPAPTASATGLASCRPAPSPGCPPAGPGAASARRSAGRPGRGAGKGQCAGICAGGVGLPGFLRDFVVVSNLPSPFFLWLRVGADACVGSVERAGLEPLLVALTCPEDPVYSGSRNGLWDSLGSQGDRGRCSTNTPWSESLR
jgi:hypothetical protein